MLLRDLKKVLNESLFNPNKPELKQKIWMEVGESSYWMTKAVELILESKNNFPPKDDLLKEAITLLAYTRAHLNEKNKTDKKA